MSDRVLPGAPDDPDGRLHPPSDVRRRLLGASIPLLPFAGLGLLGPILAGCVVYLAVPGRPWWQYVLQSVGTGWMGPVLVLSLIVVVRVYDEARGARTRRREAGDTTLTLGVFATRLRHYCDTGTGDPQAAAAIDVAHYLSDRVPSRTRREWEAESVRWYRSTAATHELPPPPGRVTTTVGKDADR